MEYDDDSSREVIKFNLFFTLSLTHPIHMWDVCDDNLLKSTFDLNLFKNIIK